LLCKILMRIVIYRRSNNRKQFFLERDSVTKTESGVIFGCRNVPQDQPRLEKRKCPIERKITHRIGGIFWFVRGCFLCHHCSFLVPHVAETGQEIADL